MPTTPNYGIELVTTQMSQKEVVLNDAFITLDGIVYSLQEAVAAVVAGQDGMADAIIAAVNAHTTAERDVILAAIAAIEVDTTGLATTAQLDAAKADLLAAIATIDFDTTGLATTDDVTSAIVDINAHTTLEAASILASIAALPSPFIQGEVKQFRRSKVPGTGWAIISDPIPNPGSSASLCLFFEQLAGPVCKLVPWTAGNGTRYVFLIPSTASTGAGVDLVRVNLENYNITTFTAALPSPSVSGACSSVYPRPSPVDEKIYGMWSSGQFYRFNPTTGTPTVETLTANLSVVSGGNSISVNEWYFSINLVGDVYAISGTLFRRWNYATNTWTALATSAFVAWQKTGRNEFDLYCIGNFIANLADTTQYFIYDITANTWTGPQALNATPGANHLTYLKKASNGDDSYEVFMPQTSSGAEAIKMTVGAGGVLSCATLAGVKLTGPSFIAAISDTACFVGELVGAEQIPRQAFHRGIVDSNTTRMWYFAGINTADNLVLAEKL